MRRVSRFSKTALLCRVCKTVKGEDAFQPAMWAKHARRGKCRDCYRAEYRERAPADAIRRHERKLVIDALKMARGCKTCGEKHPACLDFHHRDPTTKTRGIGALVVSGNSMAEIRAEIAKCEVLCANCHRKHHYEHGGGTRRKYDVPGVLPMRLKHSA